MASDTEATTEVSSLFERLFRLRDTPLFLPFVLGFTGSNMTTRENLENPRENSENPQNPDEGSPQTNTNSSERIILINPFTQGMVVIEGTSNFETLLRNLGNKDGQPPASKAAVEAMPSFKVGESENENKELGLCGECVVCLEEYGVGDVAKEMPCNHKFHANCIEKWLGIHGSCPVCRYKMPVDVEATGNKRDEQRREIWVSFSFNGERRSGGGDSDDNQTTTTPSSSDSRDFSSPHRSPDQGTEN